METELPYSIILSTHKRSFDFGNGKVINDRPLYLTSIVLESFHELLTGKKKYSLLEMKKSITSVCSLLGIDNDILSFNTDFDDVNPEKCYLNLFDQLQSIEYAVNEWVINKNFKPGKTMVVKTLEEKTRMLLQLWLAVCPSTPLLFGSYVSRMHEGDAILPLVWSEIWFYMEMDVRNVNICPHCSSIYILPSNNRAKSNCGSATCKRQHLIESHGGIEGYREWEKSRKVSPSKRGKGRPPKEKD